MHTNDEPVAYRIGYIPFLNTIIFLDSRPLIPRPETEYWVTRAIKDIREYAALKDRELFILDLCAGSGCIGVAILKAIPMARVDFAEINASHHATITKNLRKNKINLSRTCIYGGDLFTDFAKASPQYDFILTNPPYINPQKIHRVQESVLKYEPTEALFGGTDGMDYIARIITEAPRYLAKFGVLYIEHEPEQKRAIHALAQRSGYVSCETRPDQWQTDRYTRLTWAE